MRNLYIIIFVVIIGVAMVFFCTENKSGGEYLRIHIRANSNLEIDQNVKYKVKDEVVKAMIPILSECETKAEAEKTLKANFSYIESIADNVLLNNGFNYKSNAKLNNEFFPTRKYDELVLDEGFYDALILELGEAKGNNWWCVVYPPLCFIEANPYGENVVYKSKILEIIEKMMNKEK